MPRLGVVFRLSRNASLQCAEARCLPTAPQLLLSPFPDVPPWPTAPRPLDRARSRRWVQWTNGDRGARPIRRRRMTEGVNQMVDSDLSDRGVLASFVGAFFAELWRWGVRDVVVSPGSRSTPLAMAAEALPFDVLVDVDERGAAFAASGMAKAKQRPVAVVCTSGTALANYLPAVVEAESSRVPLLVLSGDRPARLQQVGAPQTFDQLHVFGTHVRGFWNMPEPSDDPRVLRHAAQIAREACIAMGVAAVPAGPTHVNFPFDEPLVADWDRLLQVGRSLEAETALPPFARCEGSLPPAEASRLARWLEGRAPVVLCGEGTFSPHAGPEERCEEAAALFAFAQRFDAPLIADPLSGLRSFAAGAVMDAADALFAAGQEPAFNAVVRFGRYPVSKAIATRIEERRCPQVVVDPFATRDFNGATTLFVPCLPAAFTRAVLDASTEEGTVPAEPQAGEGAVDAEPQADERAVDACLAAWARANHAFASRAAAVAGDGADDFEGTYVRALVDGLPDGSLLFSANSMAIRALDTFYGKSDKTLHVQGNRGLNGIDGTISSAVGAVLHRGRGALLTGDLSFIHDMNGLALQRELLRKPEGGRVAPSLAIVVLNNNGGAIFDMLPQSQEQRCFERLFLTPQDVDVQAAAQAFGVPHCVAKGAADFSQRLERALQTPGLSVIEVRLPLRGVRERYAPYKRGRA